MLKTKVYNLEGKEVEEIELSDKVFNVKLNNDLVHQAVVAQLANSRKVLANTKDRGEVRGGGRKPWRQKGTGRARHGSIRSPIWKGGGVTFGPTSNRNFSKKINKKMKMKALLMALSSKLKDNELIVVDNLKLKEPSTKKMLDVLKNLSIKERAIISIDKKEENVAKSIRNIPNVSMIACDSLNVVDLLKNKTLIINKKGIKNIEEKYKHKL
jgi:large subunit ribosomal protein L4